MVRTFRIMMAWRSTILMITMMMMMIFLILKKKMMTVLENFARMMKSVVVESVPAPALAISFASASALVAWSPP